MSQLLAIISIVMLTMGCNTLSESEEGAEFVIIHANIIPMNTESILEDYSLIIRNGKIDKIAPSASVAIPKNASVIDATGKYLMPALSDMHVHLEGDAWNLIFEPDMKFTPEEIDYSDILFQYIASGITTINVLTAFPEHIAIRDSIKEHKLLGPDMVLSRMIDGAGRAWPPPISTWVNNQEEAQTAVIEAHNLGYDHIKVYSFLSKESYNSILSTAKSLNMPVDGHIPMATSVDYVATSGQAMIAHSEEVMKFASDHSLEEISSLATTLVENDMWLTATLITTRNLINLLETPQEQLSKSGTEYLHPQAVGVWQYIYENLYRPMPESNQQYIKDGLTSFQVPFVKTFHSMGGKLLAGTDALIPPTLPGSSLHDELQELVNAGLTPYESLCTSTINAHEFLGNLAEEGSIELGKTANLVLLNGNPLEDISNTKEIEGVMTQGQWLSIETIEDRKNQIAESYINLR